MRGATGFGVLRRADIEAREAEVLAPYAMRSADSRGRAYPEEPGEYRTAFQLDRDRIIHSTAFRRLEYKTQVFVNHEGDHYRTRLTHTIEVAQISRAVARALGLNEDLVEAIALSHDLGHAPFGHAGEEVLNELLAARGGFNHNVQTLRVIDLLEQRYPEFPGLNLSWEVRESILKHPSRLEHPVPEEFEPSLSPLLEAQVTDAADSLAYDNHDIDDGLRSGFITLDDLRRVELWRRAEEEVAGRYGGADRKSLNARIISHIIGQEVVDLAETTGERLRNGGVDSPEKVRLFPGRLVGFSPAMEQGKKEMEAFLHERVYRHYRALKMAEKAKRFVAAIFAEFRRNPDQVPPEFRARIGREGPDRVICDYIAGMTDRFCQEEYKRLFHPFERM